MTTSFAHFVRGQFVKSARANTAGLLLALVCAAAIPWAGRLAFTGRNPSVYPVSDLLLWIIGSITVAALIHWFIRLAF